MLKVEKKEEGYGIDVIGNISDILLETEILIGQITNLIVEKTGSSSMRTAERLMMDVCSEGIHKGLKNGGGRV